MKKISEYTSKDGKFVHQAKAGRYGGSKPDVQKPVKGPSNKDLDKMKKEDLDEKAKPTDAALYKTLGPTKNYQQGVEALKKAHGFTSAQARGHVNRLMNQIAKADKTQKEDVEESMKPYVSSTPPKLGDKGSHDVIGKDGKVVKSYSYSKGGMILAKDHLKKLQNEEVEEGVDEKLVGNQHKLDHNKNGKLDADDFKRARAKKKGETATMNPKMDTGKGGSMEQKEAVKSADKEPEEYTDPKTGTVKYRMVAKDKDMVKKESTIRSKLLSIFEKKDPHTKGAVSDPMGSNIKGAGAQKMVDDNKDDGRYKDLEKQSHDDASKAGRVTKPAANRPNDNKQGDKKIINPVDDVTKKGQGSSEVKEESMMDKVIAYLRK